MKQRDSDCFAIYAKRRRDAFGGRMRHQAYYLLNTARTEKTDVITYTPQKADGTFSLLYDQLNVNETLFAARSQLRAPIVTFWKKFGRSVSFKIRRVKKLEHGDAKPRKGCYVCLS